MRISDMEGLVVSPSHEELSRAIDEIWIYTVSSLCAASPKAVQQNEPDMTICSSGYSNSLLNGVLGARFTSESMAERTEHAISFFRDKGLPMTFFVGPCCTPAELDDHLLHRGLAPGWARPGMAVGLDTVGRVQSPDGLGICLGDDEESLKACGRPSARGLGS